MADRTDGGAAFPTAYQHTAEGVVCVDHGGMSLRDWFAGQALSAILLSSNAENGPIAATCYAVADAMLARKEGGA